MSTSSSPIKYDISWPEIPDFVFAYEFEDGFIHHCRATRVPVDECTKRYAHYLNGKPMTQVDLWAQQKRVDYLYNCYSLDDMAAIKKWDWELVNSVMIEYDATIEWKHGENPRIQRRLHLNTMPAPGIWYAFDKPYCKQPSHLFPLIP